MAGKYTYLSEPLRYAYALFNITGQLLNASESGDGAFVSAFKQEMEDTTLASRLDFARAAFGDGSGKMANVVGTNASGATSVTLDTTINFAPNVGEVIDFTTSAGVVVSAAHTVVSVTRGASGTAAIGIQPALAAALTAGTHFPVRASIDSTTSVPNNSLNKEINGLANIVSNSGVLHGLNPATYPTWKAQVNPGGSGTAIPITDAVIRGAKDLVGYEAGLDVDSGLDFILLTTRGIRNNYAQTLTSMKRFNDAQSTTLRGGYEALMFDGNPIFTDDLCPSGYLYGLSLNKFFWSQAQDWDWMNKDGDVLKWEPRRDRYVAVLYKYCNLGVTQRNVHFVQNNLADIAR